MAIDLANMSGNVYLCADSTATTNSISCNVKFSNLALNRNANGNLEMTVDFESNGTVTINGHTATGTSMTDIAGFGGDAKVYEGTTSTTVAFAAALGAWSASIKGDTHPYSVFSSQWKKRGLGTFELTGSASGIVTLGQLMPTT